MKPHCLFPHRTFCLLALSIFVTPVTEAASNKKPIANAGIDQTVGFSTSVVLDGGRSYDPDGIIKKYQWTQIKGSKVTLARALTARPTFKSPAKQNNQKPLTLIFRLAVTDNQKAVVSDTAVITVDVLPTGKLNDTGIITCSDKKTSSLACPISSYPGQDAQFGRDVTHNDNRDGHAGFSFTKLNKAGKALPTNATSWNCVRDNVTGLMWESKTNDNGLHDKDWNYTWYEPDKSKNAGFAGLQNGGRCGGTSACDTHAYVRAVNTVGWCGAKYWRMPTVNELLGITSRDRVNPAIDTTYFPDTDSAVFWSSSPYSRHNHNAWSVLVLYGNDGGDLKYFNYRVRLVRSGL